MYNLLTNYASAIIEVLALVVLGYFALRGFKKGFVKTFFSVFGSILALIIAGLLASRVALFTETKFSFVSNVANSLKGTIGKMFGTELMNTKLSEANENFLGNLNISTFILNVILKFKNDPSIPADTTLSQLICPTFAYYIVLALCFLCLFIIFKIIFFLVGELTQKLHKIKLVAITNKILGLLLGFITGIISIQLFVLILSIIPLPFCTKFVQTLLNTKTIAFINIINPFAFISGNFATLDIVNVIKNILQIR